MKILKLRESFEICGLKARTNNADEVSGRGVIANSWGEFLKFNASRSSAAKSEIYAAYYDYENVLVTPHIAGNTYESSLRMGNVVVDNVLAVKDGAQPPDPVTPQHLYESMLSMGVKAMFGRDKRVPQQALYD